MKKIVLIFSLVLVMQNKAFPQFEMNITVPLGMSYTFPYAEGTQIIKYFPDSTDYNSIKQALGVNAGVLVQMGTRFDLKKEVGLTSISVLAEIGYSLESLGATFGNITIFDRFDRFDENYVIRDITLLHTLNLGLIPKLNFWLPSMKIPFSVGLGGGVKIPFSGTRYITRLGERDIEEDLSYQDIKKTFEYPFIPYIKVTYDIYFNISESVALTLGSYLSYDFGMKYDVDQLNTKQDPNLAPIFGALELTEYGYSSLTIGISFGISFGRPDPRPKE